MLKKRLIFVLYYDSGSFYLSRNFRLQRVGTSKWLVDKFKFSSIGMFIDEIVILNVARSISSESEWQSFFEDVHFIMKNTFVPLTIGGGLRDFTAVLNCFQGGADKVLFNSSVVGNPELVSKCIEQFGSQAVIASLDLMLKEDSSYISYVQNSTEEALPLRDHLRILDDLRVGEILVSSINQDGTGMGFDLELINQCRGVTLPLIVAGGAGKPKHFEEALSLPHVDAAATGNLFNFIGSGFQDLRKYLLDAGLPVRKSSRLIC